MVSVMATPDVGERFSVDSTTDRRSADVRSPILVLLPGLDGTGKLFAEFLKVIQGRIDTRVVKDHARHCARSAGRHRGSASVAADLRRAMRGCGAVVYAQALWKTRACPGDRAARYGSESLNNARRLLMLSRNLWKVSRSKCGCPSDGHPFSTISLRLVLGLPLLDGLHGVLDMLVGIQGGVLINDLAVRRDHIGSAVGIFRLDRQDGIVCLGDLLIRIGGHRKLVAAFAHGEFVERID